MILLENGETWDGDSTAARELYDRYFLVPGEADDAKLVDEYRALRDMLLPKTTSKHLFTILPTSACNARCYYCFEAGAPIFTMDAAAAGRAADYMIRERDDNTITVHWFGGEPLCNLAAIDHIADALNRDGRPWQSQITTNGYLFDQDLVTRAVSSWHLGYAQITLDGTRDVYNKAKAYVHAAEDPYARVLKNIELLLNAGVSVVVRMNLGTENADDCLALSEELRDRFGRYEKFSVYCGLLLQSFAEETDDTRRDIAYEKARQLEEKLYAEHLLRVPALTAKERAYQCMADDPGAVVLHADGKLYPCEHFNATEPFAALDAPQEKNTAYWGAKTRQTQADCPSCPLYAQCLRLAHCPDLADVCYAQEREKNLRILRWQMAEAYRRYLAGETPEEESDYAVSE